MKRLYNLNSTALFYYSRCIVVQHIKTALLPLTTFIIRPAILQTANGTQSTNSDYYSTPNDNYVKMRVQNPDRWSYFDDYNYDYYGGYSPYSPYSPYGYGSSFGLSVGFGAGFYSPWYGGFGYYSPMSYYNSYYAWNNFYNPYYGGVVVVNGKNTTTPSYTRMSNFNPSAYQGRFYNSRPTTNSNSIITTVILRPTIRTTTSTDSTTAVRHLITILRPYASPSNCGSGSGGCGGGASRGGGFSRPGR